MRNGRLIPLNLKFQSQCVKCNAVERFIHEEWNVLFMWNVLFTLYSRCGPV